MFERHLIFNGFHSTGWFLFSLAAVAAAVTLIVLLMRYERRLVPRGVGNTLVALRLAVIAVLFLTLLEPVISWTLNRERTGRIVVALDLSESMNTADNHAGKAEKLRWARALGMIGNPDINERLDRWIAAYQQDREPEWVDDAEAADPERRLQLAQVRKENLDGIFQEIDRLSRKEIALRLLNGTASPLLPQLQKVANVELAVFAGKTQSADEETLRQLVSQPPTSLLTAVSDLGEALTAATSESESAPIIGVVLLTDGRDNAGRDPTGIAARLGNLSTPVYPIVFGSELKPTDLAIGSLDYPQTVFKDDQPLLKVTLNTSGFQGEPIAVMLEQSGREPVTKTVTPDSSTAALEFALSADEIGRHEYTVRTEVRPGETRDDNNAKSFGMHVVDDKVRVLLLEGEARWEFRYLDNALTRDSRVEVKQVLFRQPYLGVLPDTFFPRRLDLPADVDDLENSPFAEPDLIILGDVAPADLPPQAWELLEKFVSDAGGTLVMIAGKRHFPNAYRSEVVDRMLPMTELRPVNITGAAATGPPTERGFRLRLTPEGESEPMFQFDADLLANRDIWAGLPGHLWGLLGQAKPGATVFAHALQPGEESTLEAERRNAVVVHQHYGFGQVLWLGIDSTWRWRHLVGDQYHHRFWGQLGRWAAENKAAAGNESVKFGPDSNDIEVGDDVIIRARWTQQFLRKFPKLTAKAEFYRRDEKPNGKPFSTLELHPVETRPLIHEGRAVALPAGEYRVKLVVAGADLGPDDIETNLYVHEKQTLELSDLSANRELLTQLADAGHGRVFFPDETGQLPDLFQDPTQTITQRHEIELWDHWLIMAAFFTLLTIEWVIRKLNGLP